MIPGHVFDATMWEQEMYDHIRSHCEVEEEILREYQRLVDNPETAPAFRYLARTILDDERRHHAIFEDLAESFLQMAEVRTQEEPIPSLRGLRSDRDRVIEITDRLLTIECEDAKELDELAEDLAEYQDTTLWGLLIELMRDDTAKHIKILRFIIRAAQEPDPLEP